MLKALSTLFVRPEPTAAQLHHREWRRCLSAATSQNEIDEINDLFAAAIRR